MIVISKVGINYVISLINYEVFTMFKNTLLSGNQTKKFKLSPKTLAKTSLSVLCFFIATTASASTYIYHIVEKGETLSSLSKEFNVSVAEIKRRNNMTNDTIQLGDKIFISVNKKRAKQVLSNKNKVAKVKKKTAGKAKVTTNIPTKKYRIRIGDTLSNIAIKNHTNLSTLLKINGIDKNHTLLAGKFLRVPTAKTATKVKVSKRKPDVKSTQYKPSELKTDKVGRLIYTVQNGDSLFGIAKKMQIPPIKLKKLNNIEDINNLRVGQKIIVRGKIKPIKTVVSTPKPKKTVANKPKKTVAKKTEKVVFSKEITEKKAEPQKISFSAKDTTSAPILKTTAKPQPKPKYITYTVQNGDSLSGIAKYFGVEKSDLIKFNKLGKSEYIKVGSTLIIAEKK